MNPIPNNVDWSATAAWIALAISIIGTFIGPIVTTILTNRHQLKLRQLDISEKRTETLTNAHVSAIEKFVSCTGQCLANPTREHEAECGKNYFQVYAYVPQSLWTSLDNLYEKITDRDWDSAEKTFNEIAKTLVLLLKETRQ